MRGLRFAPALLAALSAAAVPARAAIQVEARVDRRALTVGETASLEVVVRGAAGAIQEPEFELPDGIEVLGSGRSNSWVGGGTVDETVFRYELAPNRPGSFTLSPIRVSVGDEVFQSGGITLSVATATARVASGGAGPASLSVDVSPRDPYLGQPVIMKVRLVQRAPLAEDPRYTPPATPGFWAERASEPESYYADESRARVLVTETRSRLYPLVTGQTRIGEAVATLILAQTDGLPDPLQWMRGALPRRAIGVRSPAVAVRVRPLPPGAPRGFDGAVGGFTLSWSADRGRTTQDVPVTVRLDVRGQGNLPLIHTPPLRSPDFEAFASTVDDSLGAPGSSGAGRRRFQWTVLAHRQGGLEIAAPEISWFDPAARQYRSAALAPIELQVGPPLVPGATVADAFPGVFSEHPLDPFGRGPEPWGFALGGLALGVAFRLWRARPRGDREGAERARQREWLQAVGLGSGPDFWIAADRACEWLEARGRPVPHLRRQIEASRYGGARAEAEAVRRRLVDHLGNALPSRSPIWMRRTAAVAMLGAAAATCWVLGPRAGDPQAVLRARAADEAAREGDFERARSGWGDLWREGAREPGLAARLAWLEVRSGALGPASLWTLRGDREEPRDPALTWVIGQIREAGGLTGFASSRVPVRPLEWSALTLLLALATVWAWPRRGPAGAALLLLAVCAAFYPLQGLLAQRSGRAVVNALARLEGTELELEPGQVVTVLERSGPRARVSAGRGVTGWLPADEVETPERAS